MKIGIIGLGFVGSAQYNIIKNKKKVYIYDKYKNDYNKEENLENVVKSDIIFICVNTPFNEETQKQDSSQVLEVLSNLENTEISKDTVVVIKSTILYSELSAFMNISKLNIIMNPEFLNANSSYEDAITQKEIIIGGDIVSINKVIKFYKKNTVLNNPNFNICSAEEAIHFKYTRNIYGAYKTLFWEYIEDVTGNSRKMSQLMDKFSDPKMNIVGLDGKRGYAGACFPKDVKSMESNTPHLLTKFLIEFNKVFK